MKLTFQGAARTVTGSMHMVTANGKRILLDCGLFQGRRNESYQRNSRFPFDPASIDVVVLSHAHIDHSGNLPGLVKQGFQGRIICTAATRDLAAVLLRDAAGIQVSDTKFVNKIRARQGDEPVEPLYVPRDAERTIGRLVGYAYDQPIDLAPGVRLLFRDAGHILGSAIVVLEVKERGRVVRLGYSGDLGRRGSPILKDPTVIAGVDYLIIESTYAKEDHTPIAEAEASVARIINETVAHGGHVIVPAFAVGRSQELVYAMHRQRLSNTLVDTPIYVDSPLALDATEVFRLHPECFDEETAAVLEETDDPFGFRRLHYVRSVEESKTLNGMKAPFVVIAASGMCESGRVLHHLRNGIGDPANTVILVSYQAPDTLGRRLQDGLKTVRIFGEEYTVQARVESVGGFSAHADRSDLVWWASQIGASLQTAFVVHGEEPNEDALAAALLTAGVPRAVTPAPGDTISL